MAPLRLWGRLKPQQKPRHAGLKVQRVLFKDTEPHPENPRVHAPPGSPEYERLKASLTNEYFDPLVWNKRNGQMVSGHFRRTILMAEGYGSADMVLVDWDENTHRARMIAANKLNGEWNDEALLKFVAMIDKGELDATLTGWTDSDIAAILKAADAQGSGDGGGGNGESFPLVLSLKPQEHEQVMACFRLAKTVYRVGSNVEALMRILKDFSKQHENKS